MADLLEHGPRRPPWRPRGWPRWARVVAGGAAGVALVAGIAGYATTSAGRDGPRPDPSASRPAPRPATTVETAGRLLPGAPASWRLYARSDPGVDGPGEVSIVRPAGGPLRRTTLPDLGTEGPVWFVATAGGVLVQPIGPGAGYGVRDGGPAYRLTGALHGSGPVLPGPRPSLVWVDPDDEATTLTLTPVRQDRPGRRVRVPSGTLSALPDGAGGVLVPAARTGAGGSAGGSAVDVGADGHRRRLVGAVVAVGRTGLLLHRCTTGRCRLVLVDRRGATRTVRGDAPWPPQPDGGPPVGVLSPDGRTAATATDGHGRPGDLTLLDTRAGRTYRTGVSVPRDSTGQTLAWSPDGRWLFAVRTDGRLVAVDRTTRRARVLVPHLPPVRQLAFLDFAAP